MPSHCDMYILEDAHHLLMKCPYLNEERKNLFNEAYKVSESTKNQFIQNQDMSFFWLSGRPIEGVDSMELIAMWCTSKEIISRSIS